jgi:hypothetical protein
MMHGILNVKLIQNTLIFVHDYLVTPHFSDYE